MTKVPIPSFRPLLAKHGFRSIALFLCFATVACGVTSDRIYNLNLYRRDAQSFLISGATNSRNIPTFISGNPFGISPTTLANIVASSIQSAFPSREVGFVVRDSDDVRTDVLMVVAFDPPTATVGRQLCAAPGRIPSAPSSEAIRTVMAFCFGNRPLVSIEGRLDRGSGVGDAEFVVLLRDMTRRMFETSPTKSP